MPFFKDLNKIDQENIRIVREVVKTKLLETLEFLKTEHKEDSQKIFNEVTLRAFIQRDVTGLHSIQHSDDTNRYPIKLMAYIKNLENGKYIDFLFNSLLNNEYISGEIKQEFLYNMYMYFSNTPAVKIAIDLILNDLLATINSLGSTKSLIDSFKKLILNDKIQYSDLYHIKKDIKSFKDYLSSIATEIDSAHRLLETISSKHLYDEITVHVIKEYTIQ